MGVNKFTDMTREERSKFFGYSSTMSQTMKKDWPIADVPNVPLSSLPDSIDWRTSKVVTAVKDQGGCGSCWAFAAVETLESSLIQSTGKTIILSTQNMVSCTPNPQHCGGTGGCAGATSELGYQYVVDKSISSEKDYPYRAQTGKCDETKPKVVKANGWVKLPENNYTALVTYIGTTGPIAVSVDAEPWMSYSSGVFTTVALRALTSTTPSRLLATAPPVAKTTGLFATHGAASGANLATSACSSTPMAT